MGSNAKVVKDKLRAFILDVFASSTVDWSDWNALAVEPSSTQFIRPSLQEASSTLMTVAGPTRFYRSLYMLTFEIFTPYSSGSSAELAKVVEISDAIRGRTLVGVGTFYAPSARDGGRVGDFSRVIVDAGFYSDYNDTAPAPWTAPVDEL